MIASMFLSLLLISDSPSVIAVKMERGQEITWKGTFREEMVHPGVTAKRDYTIECRLFVLDVHAQGADAAILTVLKLQADKDAKPMPPVAARLVLGRIDTNGRLYALPNAILGETVETRLKRKLQLFAPISLESLPVPEIGMWPYLPEDWYKETKWDMPEQGRPFKHWKVEGIDSQRGARCYWLASDQQSEGWQESSGKAAWHLHESVWLSPTYGYAMKVERVFERRDAASAEVTYRSKLKYDHAGQIRYTARAYDDRREEITMAISLTDELEKILPESGRTGPLAFSKLMARIDDYADTQRPFGKELIYREALLATRRKADAAMHGHIPAELPKWAETSTGHLELDRPMNDFSGENQNGTAKEEWRLIRAKGHPVLLLFYQPHAGSAEGVLKAGQQLKLEFRQRVDVVGLAIGDSETARKQAEKLRISLPILNANELRKQQGIDSTPTLVLIDAEGIVRKISVGWGEESTGILRDELGKLAK